MAATYSTALKNARLQLVSDLIAGKTPAASTGTATAGKLVVLSAANVVLVTFTLPVAPFTVAGGVATLQGVPLTATGAADGNAAKAQFRDNANNTIVSGLTVGTSGADVLIVDSAISTGEQAVVTGFTIVHG